MTVRVRTHGDGYAIDGPWEGSAAANAFLTHLAGRGFSAATVRAYAFDVLNLARFLLDHDLRLAAVTPVTVFDWIDWQDVRREPRPGTARGNGRAAASTINRRVAAVRALFEYLVMTGMRSDNPGPSPRLGQGLRPQARGIARTSRPGPAPSRGQAGAPTAPATRIPRRRRRRGRAVTASLRTHRDRAIVWATLFGGLRSAEVRSLRLADVDFGRRRVRVLGKGLKERVAPVDAAFFTELSAYLRLERPPGLATEECFVAARPHPRVAEAGLRSLFRRHRGLSGAVRVRPHRLRHTYGTELASAGIDLMMLRELMGHVSPETAALYVHLSVEQLAAECGAARSSLAGTER